MLNTTLNIKPLSVNAAFKGRRFKTNKYKAFERALLLMLPKSKEKFSGQLSVAIHYGFSSRLSDIDNPTKLVLDILCKKYGFDDRYIYELHLTKEIVTKQNDFIKLSITQKK